MKRASHADSLRCPMDELESLGSMLWWRLANTRVQCVNNVSPLYINRSVDKVLTTEKMRLTPWAL